MASPTTRITHQMRRHFQPEHTPTIYHYYICLSTRPGCIYMQGERTESVYHFRMLVYTSRVLVWICLCVLHVKDISCISFIFHVFSHIYVYLKFHALYKTIQYIHIYVYIYICTSSKYILSFHSSHLLLVQIYLLAPRGGRRPSLSQAEKTHMFEPCLRSCFH